MPMVPFASLFPELAGRECRLLGVIQPTSPKEFGKYQFRLPTGRYALLEYYCNEPDCDCRRVQFQVCCEKTIDTVAWISFGFDRDAPMCGPFLDPMFEQSSHAEEVLELVADLVLPDAKYVARLERHYRMVKDEVGMPASGGRRMPHEMLRPAQEALSGFADVKAERKRRRRQEKRGQQRRRGKSR